MTSAGQQREMAMYTVKHVMAFKPPGDNLQREAAT